jgi:uncharacterized protein YndB with AHSA1/START domain
VSPPVDPGTLNTITADVEGDHATLVLRRFLRHPPTTVWRALTDPEQVRQWFLTSAKFDGRVGGHAELTSELTGVRSTGRILAWDPPRACEYEWNVVETGIPLFRGERTTVRWDLTPVEGGTLLVLTHRNLTKAAAAVFETGLPLLIDRLEALVDGRPFPPEWEARVREGVRLASGR